MKYRILYSALIVAFCSSTAWADEARENRHDIEIEKQKISKKINAQNIATNKAAIAAIQLTPGATGAAGAQGTIGLTGAAGSNGVDGATGATGAQGPIGLTGAAGSNGVDGAQGPTGNTGATGAAGTQGPRGSTGPKGDRGLSGAAGSNGAQGLAGTNGVDGATGATGAQGPIGLTGTDGAAGLPGKDGGMGLPGGDGTNGTNGTNGQDGASCTVADNGNGTATISCTDGTSVSFNAKSSASAPAAPTRQANGCFSTDKLYNGVLCITAESVVGSLPTDVTAAYWSNQCTIKTGDSQAQIMTSTVSLAMLSDPMLMATYNVVFPNMWRHPATFTGPYTDLGLHAAGNNGYFQLGPAPAGSTWDTAKHWGWPDSRKGPWHYNCTYPAVP